MSKASIPSLAKEFLRTYDAVAKDQVWKQQQEKFRSFWANRVLATTSAPLSEDECDVIIRILDAHAKGNTKDSESVARVMVTQKTWRRMFTELRANQKLAGSINQIFETDNLNQKAVLIDQLYEMNKGQKNYLTTPSANTLNALLAAYDPSKNLTVVSLNDRRRLIEFLEIPVPFDWEKTPIGTRIVQTNRILYDGLLAAGIQGSPRTASKFCYFEPVKALWKPEHTVKRTDESVSVTVPSVVDDEELEEAGAELRISPPYSLEDCATDTGFDLATLQRWKRGLERKGQAIFYGPPGTGKTFIAEKLTAHLIGGTDGIRELVQFHPAYSYEDFMQGIRPQTAADGSLAYPLVPGRFMEFCERAARRKSLCVLIIDEINRANLSRVLGELMYLLEYRNREMPLAGGGMFCIPENVRLIGTMNTADRSIALVDHALRRRFTFFPLYPDYEILSRYQKGKGFDAARLIQLLKKLNTAIADRHYEVGITFFLRDNLESQIADIWQTEIEPYLEEFFFDQPQKFELFRWKAVQPEILP